jgi:signal transduction histidine kinase
LDRILALLNRRSPRSRPSVLLAAGGAGALLLLGLSAFVWSHSLHAVLVTDPAGRTPYYMRSQSMSGFPAHMVIPVPSLDPSQPDKLLAFGPNEVAQIVVEDGVGRFWWQRPRIPAAILPVPDRLGLPGLFWARTSTLTGASLLQFDADLDSVRVFGPVPGMDRDGNGTLGLGLVPAGLITRSGRNLLVAAMNNDRDRDPRGVACFDYETAEVQWIYRMAQDPQMVSVVDLVGDSAPEILIAGWAPNNGASLDGRSDNLCCVSLLDWQGHELWYREGGGPSGLSTVGTCLLQSGERPKIAWLISPHSATSSLMTQILLLDPADGRTIQAFERKGGCVSLGFLDLNADGNEEILCGFSDGHLLGLDHELSVMREQVFSEPIEVLQTRNLCGDESSEIVGMLGRSLCVLDPSFHLLAMGPPPLASGFRCLMTGALGDFAFFRSDGGKEGLAAVSDQGILQVSTMQRRGLTLRGVGLPLAAVYGLLMLAVLTGGGVAWRVRDCLTEGATATRRLPTELVSTLHREVSRALHAMDNQAGPLSRLHLLFGGMNEGRPLDDRVRERIADAAEAFLGQGSLAWIDLAFRDRRTRNAFPELRSLRESYGAIHAELSRLARASFAQEQVQSACGGLFASLRSSVNTLRSLQRKLRGHLRADLPGEIVRVLHEERARLADSGIDGIHLDQSGCGSPHVFIDPADLREVLRNLLSNSLRAMAKNRGRELAYRIYPEEEVVRLEFADTGCGVPSDMWEQIFTAEGTTKIGGGFGLPHIRLVLQEYRGWIEVTGSEPGRGTTMLLTFKSASRVAEPDRPVPTRPQRRA